MVKLSFILALLMCVEAKLSKAWDLWPRSHHNFCDLPVRLWSAYWLKYLSKLKPSFKRLEIDDRPIKKCPSQKKKNRTWGFPKANPSMKEGNLFCFVVMRSTELGCFRSCSWCLPKALGEEGCMGLVPWHLDLQCNFFLILNDFFTRN
jgi:hypothetical protein